MEYISTTLQNLVHQTAFMNLTGGNLVMIGVACFFLYLAIRHEFEPLLLLPIAFAVVGAENMNSLTIVTASILAGAVCGDHVSPISDTTILASAGAQCHHINHVSTQIPYVLCVAACCFLGYLAAGITANGWVGTGVGFAALIVVLVILDRKNKGTKEA